MLIKRFIPLQLLLPIIMLLSGCAISPPELTSKIDSRAVTQASHYKTYWLLPGQDDIKTNDLAYREYSHYVDISLQQSGYVKAASPNKANVIIFLAYGTSQPRNHLYTDDRTIIDRPSFFNLDADDFADAVYISQLKNEIVYSRYIKMDAYEAEGYKKNKPLEPLEPLEPLWSVKAVSVGQSDDLRQLFPYILVSMMPYIGIDSQHQVTVSIKSHDPQVSQLIMQSKRP